MANKDNPAKGNQFTVRVQRFLAAQGIHLRREYQLNIGVSTEKKSHAFDLGSDDPKIIVECKFHAWTAGHNTPSAKMSVWNEAMYFFALAPDDYQKMLFVRLHRNDRTGITLFAHYMNTNRHLIPHGVEIWEFEDDCDSAKCMHEPQVRLV